MSSLIRLLKNQIKQILMPKVKQKEKTQDQESEFHKYNEKLKKEGKSYLGHYRPKSEFRRGMLRKEIQQLQND